MHGFEADRTDSDMSQFTKTSKTIALCSAANFINAADRVIMPIAIIQMSAQFKWDLHEQGWILSAFSIGYICTMVGTFELCIFIEQYTFNLYARFYVIFTECLPHK